MKKTVEERSLSEIMTRNEVAAWLKIRPRQIDRLGIPCMELGHKTKRYVVKDVAAWLENQRRGVTKVRKQHVAARGTPLNKVLRGVDVFGGRMVLKKP